MTEQDAQEEMTLALRRLEHLVKCTDVTSRTPRGSTQNPFDGLLKVVGRYKTAQGPDAEVGVKLIVILFGRAQTRILTCRPPLPLLVDYLGSFDLFPMDLMDMQE